MENAPTYNTFIQFTNKIMEKYAYVSSPSSGDWETNNRRDESTLKELFFIKVKHILNVLLEDLIKPDNDDEVINMSKQIFEKIDKLADSIKLYYKLHNEDLGLELLNQIDIKLNTINRELIESNTLLFTANKGHLSVDNYNRPVDILNEQEIAENKSQAKNILSEMLNEIVALSYQINNL